MSTRVIFITGGAQGIGLALCRRFLGEGWAAVVFDADVDALNEAATGLSALGDVLPVCGDVMSEGDVTAAFEAAGARCGRIDALINNAGIGIGKPLAELSLAEWNRVIGVNLTGAFLCTRAAAPWLRRQRGSIVNIASTRARQSEANTEAYAASKGGLVALTHASAISLGPEIRVNCVLPGWIDTSAWKKASQSRHVEWSVEDHAQHPCGRVGTPEDVAAMVAYLVGDECGFVTGAEFVIDGGMTRKMIYV